ncbi:MULTISPECIES: cytochrome c maturation protein CcmE [Chelativorans]|jgi:cytochrome c-type biogenesis protein CcmE|uniref:Cytochrome c-type biogenesis protein CcmE n=1 Tax=Chelativorans sp. (strain BNC1) TaxID=266779 RepID=CCME_CHESB|nr:MULTISPECIES: cytochrome c maturation protein CcmE [Chelativorans]Q11JY0.1 RecName: Full=Cytochrome c-type biogenesis protein CcmE; AltName: Full=Cytochrome c maturation protein E; AltName: Full=Heme chaperone CcmE [Chelativorans sp. BNC1]
MTRKQKRLAVIGSGMGFLALAAALTFYALGQQTSYFYMPSDLLSQPAAAQERIRLGGLVQQGSVERGQGTHVSFVVADGQNGVPVVYDGILPDLFREEQGVVIEGRMGPDGVFVADTVLAKHDETYMPREVADRLKKDGLWQEQ